MIEQVMDLRADESVELTTADRAELLRYEAVIKRGLDTFVSVGNALLAIRRDRLYRATHGTFQDYCRQRWQMTPDYANKLIGAAGVVGNLNTNGIETLPATEREARPLTKLPPEQQPAAYQKAIDDNDGDRPTAAQVTKAAANFAPKREPRASPVERIHKPTPTPAPEPAAPVYIASEPNPTLTHHEAVMRDIEQYDVAMKREVAEWQTVPSPTVTITLERVIAEKLVAAVHVKALWRHLQEQEMIVLELVLSEALEP